MDGDTVGAETATFPSGAVNGGSDSDMVGLSGAVNGKLGGKAKCKVDGAVERAPSGTSL